jgi:hypothetical protein
MYIYVILDRNIHDYTIFGGLRGVVCWGTRGREMVGEGKASVDAEGVWRAMRGLAGGQAGGDYGAMLWGWGGGGGGGVGGHILSVTMELLATK